jgi:uncharacterized protein (DUF2267 family)
MTMSSARSDPFNHALHTANIWLADIGAALGTRDRRYTHRVVRAWMHTLRDRLTVDAAAKFGAQLPELLRGVYYDGWEPNKAPVKYNVEQYIQRFAGQASIPAVQVPTTAATITEVMADRMSPGQVSETLAELPTDLRATVTGTGTGWVGRAATPATPPPPAQDRLNLLEDQVSSLTEAVRALAHGLEGGQPAGSGVNPADISRAARFADEILIAAGTQSPP